MRPNGFSKIVIIRAGLLFLLLFFSFALIFTTYQNYQSAKELADQSLKNTALALAATAENVLTATKHNNAIEKLRNIMSDRVIAYALITDRNGVIIYHTNERLLGGRIDDLGEKAKKIENGKGQWITLGTGISAYEFNSLCRLPNGAFGILRLVLHTHSAERIISRANRQWGVVVAILLLLWTLGILLDRFFVRQIDLEKEMAREKELGLIGQMSSVLAHEIRNALGSVKGYVQYMDEKTPATDSKKGIYSLILQGTDRIETLVGDMLTFSRREDYRLESISIEPLLKESVSLALGSWPRKIDWKEIKGNVRADREKLLRALINLIRNAMEAMQDTAGTVHIATTKKGGNLVICIEDDGPGISDEVRERLFVPFFTTKASGTGLGLAIAKKLVEGMGGKLTLANRPDKKGAVATVQLLSD